MGSILMLGSRRGACFSGTDRSAAVRRSHTALWAACHGGQEATAKYLLQQGADLNWVAPWDGTTPLDAARRNNFHELAAWLAEQGG
jgi:hypothetical protein